MVSKPGSGPSCWLWGEGEVVPGSQVLWPGWAIKHRQDVKVLLQSKGLEHKLDPVLVLRGDRPRAVGVIGVAIREPWALDCPIGTLQLECAVLAWERERERFSTTGRMPTSFHGDGHVVSKNHYPSLQLLHRGQQEERRVTDTECELLVPCAVLVIKCVLLY